MCRMKILLWGCVILLPLLGYGELLDELERYFTVLNCSQNTYSIKFQARGDCYIKNPNYPTRCNDPRETITVNAATKLVLRLPDETSVAFYNWQTLPSQMTAEWEDLKKIAPCTFFICRSFFQDVNAKLSQEWMLMLPITSTTDPIKSQLTAWLEKRKYKVYTRDKMLIADVPKRTIDIITPQVPAPQQAKVPPGNWLIFFCGKEIKGMEFQADRYIIKFADIPQKIYWDAECDRSDSKRRSAKDEVITISKYTKIKITPEHGQGYLSICCWDNTDENDIELVPEFKTLAHDVYFLRKHKPDGIESKALIVLTSNMNENDISKAIEIFRRFPRFEMVRSPGLLIAWRP